MNFSSAYSPGTSSSCYFLPPNSGIYFIRVTVTSDDALVTTYSKMIKAEICPSTEFVATDEAEFLSDIKIFGNPTEDYVIISNLGYFEILDYYIFNLTGQLIFPNSKLGNAELRIDAQEQKKIPLLNFVPGMYILTIKTSMGTKSFQIVKN